MSAFLVVGVLVMLLWGAEEWRLASATGRLHALQDRYSIVAAQRKKTEALVARLGVLTLLQTEVGEIRLSGEERAAEIVDVGNHLPPSVFLESLTPDDTNWRLAGHAASMDQVGAAVVSLQRIAGAGIPRLRQVRSDGARVEYELDFGRGADK